MCPKGPKNKQNNDIRKQHHQQSEQNDEFSNNLTSEESNETPTKQPITTWNHLPILTLHKIFKHLLPEDRLLASSTCRSWRSIMFSRELWPAKTLKINLCSHKYAIEPNISRNNNPQAIAQQFQSNQFLKSGISSFDVDDESNQYYYNQPLFEANKYNINRGYNTEHKHQNRFLKRMLRSCDRFLKSLTIYFDPNSANNVVDLIQIIRHLSVNDNSRFLIDNNHFGNCESNCAELRSLRLVPICPLVKTVKSVSLVQLYHELTDELRILLSKVHHFESISIGNLHELASSIDELFCEFFNKESNVRSIKKLDLCTVKGDPYSYIFIENRFSFLSKLSNLQCLCLDFDVLNSTTVRQISELTSLQSFTVNVHRFDYDHEGINHESTRQLSQSCPKIRLMINLLHIDSVHLGIVKESLLNTDISLKTLRVYFLDLKESQWQLFYNMLDIVSRRHSQTIDTLILIDNIRRPKKFFKYSNVNALVMFSWMCRQLHYLTIIGYEISSADIIAIARLRGTSLRNFYLPYSCIDFHLEQYHQYINNNRSRSFQIEMSRYIYDCVSLPLKRLWRPIEMGKIAPIIHSRYPELLTYHRTIMDQNVLL